MDGIHFEAWQPSQYMKESGEAFIPTLLYKIPHGRLSDFAVEELRKKLRVRDEKGNYFSGGKNLSTATDIVFELEPMTGGAFVDE